MTTGYLIDEYYVGPFKIQKRAVCGVRGNLLTYSYETYGNKTSFYSDDCLSEKEALKKLFDAVKSHKKDVDEEFRELSNILGCKESNEKYS